MSIRRARPVARALVGVSFVLAALAPAVALQMPKPPGRDLALLQQWLTGEFDNFQQVSEEQEAKAVKPHDRIHTVIEPVVIAGLGGPALLASQSERNEPDTIARLHVYSLLPDPQDGSIELRLYAFKDAQAAVRAAADRLKDLQVSLDQLRRLVGCEVIWRREGDAFVGATKPGACRAPWPATGRTVTIAITYRLTADAFWFNERATDEAGTVVFSQPGDVPYKLGRARPFTCWAALRKEGTADQYDGWRDLAVHDQGKKVPLPPQSGRSAKYAFQLSQLRYNQQLPVMTLAIYEAGTGPAVAYTWANPQAVRIGINLRWVQVGCTAKNP